MFDEIYILNLHGNARKKETAPDGSKDENVFDIMQGVSIKKEKRGQAPVGSVHGFLASSRYCGRIGFRQICVCEASAFCQPCLYG